MNNPQLRFIIGFIISSTVILIVILTASVYLDPRGLFGTGKFRPLVINARPDKINLLKQFPVKPEILILGASTIFKFNPVLIQQLTGQVTFNFGIDNGKAEDWLALTRYALEDLGIKPKLLIIGIDYNAFDHFRMQPQVVLMKTLRSKLDISQKQYWSIILETLRNNLTIQYIGDMGRMIYYIFHGYPRETQRFLSNGYSPEQIIDREHTQESVEAVINSLLTRIGGSDLSPERKQYFEKLLQLAIDNQIQINVALLPLHPELSSRFSQTPELDKLYKNTNAYLEKMSKKYNFNYYDLVDLKSIHGDPTDFFSDGFHMGDSNSNNTVKTILQNYKIKP